jgi:speckle-type POZ protein
METQVIANSAPSTKSELSAISSYCCQTKGVVNEINFEWTIERSAFFGDLGIWETLKSAEFSDSKFFLTLDTTYDCIVRIYLDRHSNSSNYPIRVEFAIFNEKDEEICEKTATTGISKGIARSLLFQMNKKDLLESRLFCEWKYHHFLQNQKFDQKATNEKGCSNGETSSQDDPDQRRRSGSYSSSARRIF